MSQNGNSRRNGGRQNGVSGPTSALTSFLREHGISVRNISRRERREREIAAEVAAFTAATANSTEETAESSSSQQATVEPMEGVEMTNSAAESSTAAAATATTTVAYRRSTRSKAKKRVNDDSDDDDNNQNDFAPSSSRRAAAGRARIIFCTECKGRFARKLDDDQDQTICPNCLNGTTALKKKRPVARKRQIVSIKKDVVSKELFPSLQDLCISVVAEFIDDVESLGIISEESLEKLSKIISKNRKLNDVTSRLFMDPVKRRLSLYDCTNMNEVSLLNISQFCPYLEYLELIYCGRINDKVLDAFIERLHHLKSLKLSGAFLISTGAYNRFFEHFSKQLEVFELRHSALFKQTNIESLAKHCVNLRELKLSHLSNMHSDWLDSIKKFNKLTTLEFSWCPDLKTTDVVQMLSEIGPQLTELSIRGGHNLDDKFLLQGVLKYCKKLKKLNLEQCDNLTAKGMIALLNAWETKGLTHLNISRCLKFDDKVIEAVVRHSGPTLKHLNIHSLDLLTASGVEVLGENGVCQQLTSLDCGFVRSIDDFVLKKIIDHSPSLNKIFVWGCPLLTDNLKATGKLNIVGKELTIVV